MIPTDAYIRKQMKRFAARHMPPANGKKRLLRAASISGALNNKLLKEHPPISWARIYDNGQNSNWSILSFDWSLIYSLGALNLRHVL